MPGEPVLFVANAPVSDPSVAPRGAGHQALAEALAGLNDPARTVRTPTALAADLLAQALLQRRFGPPPVAPVPQAAPLPSLSPGAPAPSAPAGTASAAPAAASPAAGAATAAASGAGDPRLRPPPPDLLNDARAAIAKGADPVGIRARLAAHGFDPGAL